MACDITASIGAECKDNLGGASKFYVFVGLDDPFTLVASECTAINAALTTVFEYDIIGDLNTLTQSLVPNRDALTTVNTQTISLSIGKMSAAKAVQFNLLAKGFPMCGVKDRNGNIHAVGIDDGIDFTIEAMTGSSKTDKNGFTLTGTSTTGELAPIMDAATATAFLALV